MHDVKHKCVIDFLAKNGFEPIHTDSWAMTDVTYYFLERNRIVLRLTSQCVPYDIVLGILGKFGLDKLINQIMIEECYCE